MQKILEHLNQEKLGTPLLPPFKEFSGKLAAKIERTSRNTGYVVSKWNPATNQPDVAYDPNANLGTVSKFIELYDTPKSEEAREVETELTVKQITEKLVEFGMEEKDILKLGNKQAKLDKLNEFIEAESDKEKE